MFNFTDFKMCAKIEQSVESSAYSVVTCNLDH